MASVDNYLSCGDQPPHGISVDDFIKTFSVNESPARPTLAHMGATYDPHSSPYRPGTMQQGDSGANNTDEWFGVDYNSMSITSSTPSSRGSSLETPNMQHAQFMPSIDPSRLKEIGSSFADSAVYDLVDHAEARQRSPPWSGTATGAPTATQQQPQMQQQPPPLTLNTTNLQMPSAPVSVTSAHNGSPLDLTPRVEMSTTPMSASTVTASGSKRKRQGSLPEIYIPMSQQTLGTRGLQRSVSTGAAYEPGDYMPPLDTRPTFISQASPVVGPMSAPPMSHHPHSFAGVVPQGVHGVQVQVVQQAVPAVPQPTQMQQQEPIPQGTPHNAVSRFSSLATIPETPNSAPADTQHFVAMGQQPQLGQQPPQPHQQQLQTYRYAAPASELNYGVITPTLPASTGHSPMIPQGNPIPMGRPMHLMHNRSASAGFPLPPRHHQQQQHQQHQHMHMAGSYQPLQTGHPSGLNPNMRLGMGRPINTPAHMRRSSDSELAFAGGPNIGAMARSTSVPQAAGQRVRAMHGMPVYGMSQCLPPPPPVTTYSAHNIAGPYAESFVTTTHNLYGDHPALPSTRSRSPPRKRVASKRVGTCLKPGPKSKMAKAKSDTSPSGSSTTSLPDVTPVALAPPAPVEDYSHLAPVSVDEFKAAFDRTPSGTLIPKPGMDQLMERMMYATDESVVDQCFRYCYVVGSEYHKVAEKQSKFFKCSFDECVGSSTRLFMRKSAVDSHVRTHVGFRPFKCQVDPDCDARFVRKHDRDRHVATTHKNEKSFMCDDCGQNFARSDALLRHRAKRDACKARMG